MVETNEQKHSENFLSSADFNENSKFFRIYKDLLYNNTPDKKMKKRWPLSSPERVEDAATERDRINNEGLRQDIKMKKGTLWVLFGFLAVETIAIFVLAFFQAVSKPWDFKLEEWSFRLLISATISQITVMLIIAVKHLFPQK